MHDVLYGWNYSSSYMVCCSIWFFVLRNSETKQQQQKLKKAEGRNSYDSK
jgi:hypothetical protein